ncbi:hypothetical protein BC937DRAFT_87237, partial [Endogone sp. FLAS-F59071]
RKRAVLSELNGIQLTAIAKRGIKRRRVIGKENEITTKTTIAPITEAITKTVTPVTITTISVAETTTEITIAPATEAIAKTITTITPAETTTTEDTEDTQSQASSTMEDYNNNCSFIIQDYDKLSQQILFLMGLQEGAIISQYGVSYPNDMEHTGIKSSLEQKGLSLEAVSMLDFSTLAGAGIKLGLIPNQLHLKLEDNQVSSINRIFRVMRNDLYHRMELTNSWWGAGVYVITRMNRWVKKYKCTQFLVYKKERAKYISLLKVESWNAKLIKEIKMQMITGLGDTIVTTSLRNDNEVEELTIQYYIQYFHKRCALSLLDKFKNNISLHKYEEKKMEVKKKQNLCLDLELWPTHYIFDLLIALWPPNVKQADQIIGYQSSTVDVLFIYKDIITCANDEDWNNPIFLLLASYNLRVIARMVRHQYIASFALMFEKFSISLWR